MLRPLLSALMAGLFATAAHAGTVSFERPEPATPALGEFNLYFSSSRADRPASFAVTLPATGGISTTQDILAFAAAQSSRIVLDQSYWDVRLGVFEDEQMTQFWMCEHFQVVEDQGLPQIAPFTNGVAHRMQGLAAPRYEDRGRVTLCAPLQGDVDIHLDRDAGLEGRAEYTDAEWQDLADDMCALGVCSHVNGERRVPTEQTGRFFVGQGQEGLRATLGAVEDMVRFGPEVPVEAIAGVGDWQGRALFLEDAEGIVPQVLNWRDGLFPEVRLGRFWGLEGLTEAQIEQALYMLGDTVFDPVWSWQEGVSGDAMPGLGANRTGFGLPRVERLVPAVDQIDVTTDLPSSESLVALAMERGLIRTASPATPVFERDMLERGLAQEDLILVPTGEMVLLGECAGLEAQEVLPAAFAGAEATPLTTAVAGTPAATPEIIVERYAAPQSTPLTITQSAFFTSNTTNTVLTEVVRTTTTEVLTPVPVPVPVPVPGGGGGSTVIVQIVEIPVEIPVEVPVPAPPQGDHPEIAPIPLPAGMVLLLTGLAGLVVMRKRAA